MARYANTSWHPRPELITRPYPWMCEMLREVKWPIEVCQYSRINRGRGPGLARAILYRHTKKMAVHMLDSMVEDGLLAFHELPPLSDGRRHWLYYPSTDRPYVPDFVI